MYNIALIWEALADCGIYVYNEIYISPPDKASQMRAIILIVTFFTQVSLYKAFAWPMHSTR